MTRNRATSRRIRALPLLLVALASAGAAQPAAAQVRDERGVTRLISTSTAGAAANQNSGDLFYNGAFSDPRPQITPDGRFVVFTSEATNLVSNDGGHGPDVYVRDRDADEDGLFDEIGAVTTTLVSETEAGTRTEDLPSGVPSVRVIGGVAQNGSMWPSVSHDGRYVAFTSFRGGDSTTPTFTPGLAMLPSDTNQGADVFVKDRDADGNGVYDEPNVDADDDGVYEARGTRVIRVSLRHDGTQARDSFPVHSYRATISGDGRFVSFYSWGPLTLDDTNTCGTADNPQACADLYLYDRDRDGDGVFDEPGETLLELVSKNSAGVAGNDHSGAEVPGFAGIAPAMSGDGRFVAFQSQAFNLTTRDTNQTWDVFVRDRRLGTTKRISINYDSGAQGWAASTGPLMTEDGRYVFFSTGSSTISPVGGGFVRLDRDGDQDGVFDELGAATYFKPLRRTDGSEAPGASNVTVSPSGRYIGWQAGRPSRNSVESAANQFGQTAGTNVYVRDNATGITRIASVTAEGTTGTQVMFGQVSDAASFGIGVSDSGWSAFFSRATDLTEDDRNVCIRQGGYVPFVRDPGTFAVQLLTDPANTVVNFLVSEFERGMQEQEDWFENRGREFERFFGSRMNACTDVFVRAPGAGYCLTPNNSCPYDDRY